MKPEVLLATISDLIRKARSEKATSDVVSRASRTTIHVIDDDPIIREAMRHLFEAVDYVVITFAAAKVFLATSR